MLMTEIAPESASRYSRPSVSQIRIPSPRRAVRYARRTSCGNCHCVVVGSVALMISSGPTDRLQSTMKWAHGSSEVTRLDTHLFRADDGELLVERVCVRELAERYGTPLHVLSETRLRE